MTKPDHVNGADLDSIQQEVHLSSEQEQAVIMCCDRSNTIAGVTGEAGTGKTLVLGKVYEQLHKRWPTVLCAPTGRAAKRIQELTKIPARTIHRLLRFPMPDDYVDNSVAGEPLHNAENPVPFQVIIVDEASMLGPTLFQQLINAMPRNGMIRFFGDNNQLPPVEEGKPPFISILKEFPSVTLSFNFRSGDDIVSNAHRILQGRMPMRNDRFEIIYKDDPMAFQIQWATQEFSGEDCQIITPTRKGSFGTIRLNPSMQLRFNKQGYFLALDRYEKNEPKLLLKPGDKFIWVMNDYVLNLFNGEMGVVDWIDDEDGSIGLVTDGREITIPPRAEMFHPYERVRVQYDPRKKIELGYTITTHKAQGSEFKTVVVIMHKGQFYTINRRNFYTAITRAKQNVIVICDRGAMGIALRPWKQIL